MTRTLILIALVTFILEAGSTVETHRITMAGIPAHPLTLLTSDLTQI